MYQFDSRVRYSEVDSGRELTLPSLLDYFQDCCTFQSEDLGVGVDYLSQNQTAWMLSSWEIRLNRNPRMGERIRVSTWPYQFKGFYGYRNFKLEDADGNLLAAANSVWVYMDTASMRPARIGGKMEAVYGKDLSPQIEGEWSQRKIPISAIEAAERKAPVSVARCYIDTNLHMNNGKYILVAQEYLPEAFKIGRLRAEYKKSAVSGDVLYPAVITEEHQVTVLLSDEKGNNYAVVQFLEE